MGASDEESIQSFLSRLPRDTEGVPAGSVAIFKHTVEEFGGDLAAVDEWVQRNGGRVRAVEAPAVSRTGAPPVWRYYYEIPERLLTSRPE